jgi:hypothetical protein
MTLRQSFELVLILNAPGSRSYSATTRRRASAAPWMKAKAKSPVRLPATSKPASGSTGPSVGFVRAVSGPGPGMMREAALSS